MGRWFGKDDISASSLLHGIVGRGVVWCSINTPQVRRACEGPVGACGTRGIRLCRATSSQRPTDLTRHIDCEGSPCGASPSLCLAWDASRSHPVGLREAAVVQLRTLNAKVGSRASFLGRYFYQERVGRYTQRL